MNRLFVRLLMSYVLVLLTAVAVVFGTLSYFYTERMFAEREKQLVENGIRLAQTYEASFNPFQSPLLLRTRLEAIAGTLQAHITITDAQGLITMTTGEQAEGRIILKADDVRRVLTDGTVVTRRGFEEAVDNHVLTAIVPIRARDNVVGAVVLHAPMSDTLRAIGTAARLLLLAGSVAVAAGILVSFFLSRRITAPIADVTAASEEMAQGRFDRRIATKGADEIAALGSAFNRLSERLGHTIHALTEEKSKTESILTAMNEGLLAVNHAGDVILTNPAFYKLTDMETSPPIEGSMDNDHPVLAALSPAFHRVLQGEAAVTSELTFGEKTLMLQVTPLIAGGRDQRYEPRSTPSGAVGILRDQSEKERLERMRRHFLANVSHELQTPLTSIRGFAQALLEGVVQGEEQTRRYLHVIMDESLRLTRLVHTILDLSRIESDAMRLHLESLDVGELIEDVMEIVTPLVEQRDIVTDVRVAPLPTVDGDRDRLTQVLLNLLDNAIRHAPQGGTVSVKAAPDRLKGEPAVTIAIENDGATIAEEELPFIWDRFYKVDKSRRYIPDTGTGLGLVIVKQLVERHRGEVDVCNLADDQGVRFTVTIPHQHRRSETSPDGSGGAIP